MENNFFDYESYMIAERERTALKRTALAIGLSVIIFFVSSYLAGYALATPTYYILESVPTVELYDVVYELYTALIYALPLLLAIIPIPLLTRIPLKVALPMRKPQARIAVPGVMAALGSSVIGITIASVLLTLFQTAGLGYDVPTPPVPETNIGILMYIFTLSVLPAILEEILFRGFILQSLRRFGDMFAVIISALVFALVHGNFAQLPNAFIMGVTIAFLAVKTGSLIPGMILHFINNFGATVLDVFLISRTENEVLAGIYSLGYMGLYFFVGIIGIIILLVRDDKFFTLVPYKSPLTVGQRTKAFFLQPVALTGIVLMLVFCCTFFVL